ncbi:MAG: fibronectin type III domain-containing protein [Thermoplasmata archaeon]|nr:MAG: fibronectin type III domain-containing protein [Thermoplasmata archaeon]
MNVKADPPAGYNHRPIDEFFTSLACGPCVDLADPVQDEVWKEWGYDSAVRYNWVVFHTYAPDPDDLSTEDGRDRQSLYNPALTNPTIIYDGGYIKGSTADDAEETKGYFDDCGTRDVEREIEVYIEQEYVTEGIEFHYQVQYLGGEGTIPDGTPTVDDITASIYIFVVEDNVTAYSTVIDENYLCHNVFREYALELETQLMEVGDWINGSVVWPWPSSEPTIPIQPHLVKGIIGVYDEEDTNSGDPTVNAPRLSNSANYISTIWDWGEEAPTISNVQINRDNFNLTISADLTDPDGISSAWLIYNVTDSAYNWTTLEMDIAGGNQASVTFTETRETVVDYTILAFDNNHLQSQTRPEHYSLNVPPAEITDLAATPGSVEGEVNLTWTAPGDNASEGTASKYHIRYSASDSITEANWDSAISITDPPTPQIAGSTEKFTVGGLTPDATYYFAIKAEDAVGNIGAISNSPSALAPSDPGDVTPPEKIDNLQAEPGENAGEVILTWTAVGDDGNTGTASKYYIKYSQNKISTESDWDSATTEPNTITPRAAGSQESFTIDQLDPDDILYFAVRAEDDMELVGSISNSPSVTVPGADVTAPAKITNLAATPGENEGEITLTWTAPGDDGNSGGKAAKYEVKYSLSDITNENEFNDATGVTGEPTPKNPGDTEIFTVTDLTPDTGYYLAIVTEDEVPNPSAVSDSAYGVAASAPQGVIAFSDIFHTPTNPTEDDEVTISATVVGENTIESVKLEYCKGDLCYPPVSMETTGDDIYSVDLGQLEAGKYHYTVKAEDDSGKEGESNEGSFTVSEGQTSEVDTDGDGFNDDDDAFPNDPAASVDTDGDGFPDEWNPGKTADDSTTGLKLDAYPDDPAKWATEKEEEIPWYEEEDSVYMIGIILLVIIILIVVIAMTRRSKKTSKAPPVAQAVAVPIQPAEVQTVAAPVAVAQPVAAEPVFTAFQPTQPATEDISCPSCGTVFAIPLSPRPLQVQCPGCAIKGVID